MSASRYRHSTSWQDLGIQLYSNGIQASQFTIGDGTDSTEPLVLRSSFPPGITIDAHSHESDYAEIILQGSERVGRVWHHAGDIRIVKGGTHYGPLTAGPEGVTKLVIF